MKQLLFAFLISLMSLANCNSLVFAEGLSLVENDSAIRVALDGKPVLQYLKKSSQVPQGLPQHFSRSGYIHPVYTPAGQELTGDYPADHAHQHALFSAWTKSNFDGRKIDFWNQAKGTGRIEFRKVLQVERKEEQVSFTVEHAYLVKTREGWRDALTEEWTVTVYKTNADQFLFDVKTVQQCVSSTPLLLPQYHYGGMALRGNIQWLQSAEPSSKNQHKLAFLTSEGKDRDAGNHTHANWVALSGKIDGQNATAVVFCNPNNFRAPQAIRIHPNKPYFCFAPMVDGPFEIGPSKPYTSEYRYLITASELNEDFILKTWDEYRKRAEAEKINQSKK